MLIGDQLLSIIMRFNNCGCRWGWVGSWCSVGVSLWGSKVLQNIGYMKYNFYILFVEVVSDEEIKYDVFVIFSSKDSQWVMSNLIFFLERNCFKYCIYSWDFELGRVLVDNMVESVYLSCKVLVVMFKNYMDSKFCRGELDMVLY